MAMSTGSANSSDPMMEINTTPLIDVMLVLLIMLIITIPPQTHAVKIDLPQPDPNDQRQQIDTQKNKIVIDPTGAILWNGTPIDEPTLSTYLEQTKAIQPEPELHFQPDASARYEKVDEVLAIIKRSNVTKLGFVGNEQYRNDF